MTGRPESATGGRGPATGRPEPAALRSPSDRWTGELHVYLGAMPGVGKTHTMLAEGRRLAARGVDVLVGLLETHGRQGLEDLLGDLTVLPRLTIEYRGSSLGELDVDAILAARPAVVLVDELAHSNAPGSRHDKRWQDVDELLRSGIDVITTLNVVHLAELHDAVEEITGVSQREFVPEAVVLAADRIDFVDADPNVVLNRLRSRAARNRAPAAVPGVFADADRLDMLRRLARTWLTEHHRIGTTPAGPGMTIQPGPVVVALAPGAPPGRAVRRAAQLAALRHAPLVGVSVRDTSGIGEAVQRRPASLERMLAEFGGRYAEVGGSDIAWELARFATREGAGVLVIGDTPYTRGRRLLHGSIARRTLRLVRPMDVYVVPPWSGRLRRVPADKHRRALRRTALPPRRQALSWLLAVAGPVALMAMLVPARASIGLGGALICGLVAVLAAALAGGVRTALLATAVAVAAADYLFAAPYDTLRVHRLIDVAALIAFAVCGGVIGALAELLAGGARKIARARAEADQLARLAASTLIGAGQPTADLAAQLRAALEVEAVAFLDRDGDDWRLVAGAGDPVPDRPAEGQFAAEISPGRVLIISGAVLAGSGSERRQLFTGELLLARRREDVSEITNAYALGPAPHGSR